MKRSLALLIPALLAACGPAGNSGTGSTGSSGTSGSTGSTGSTGTSGCVPAMLCYPGCDPSGGGCQRGVLDVASCTCQPLPASPLVRLAVAPQTASLLVGKQLALHAIGTFGDGTSEDLSSAARWSSSAPEVATVAAPGMVTAVAPGQATITAAFGGKSAGAQVNVVPSQEARAVWVTRFTFHGDPVQGPADIKAIIDGAAAAHFNVVVFQVSGDLDAFFRSNVLPWSMQLTGTLGADPGWDPLQVALDEAHKKGLQLHAWVNAFSGWCAAGNASCPWPVPATASGPQHALHDHPDWLAVDSSGRSNDSEYRWVSAGVPDARALLASAVADLLERYPVDGIHLDRIRYPGPDYSRDAISNQLFQQQASAAGGIADFGDWERQNVDDAVSEVYAAVLAARPQAVLSASVTGIYQQLVVNGSQCHTSDGFGEYYQDSWGWMRLGIIDILFPEIYWDFGSHGGCTDWGTLAAQFLAHAAGRGVWLGMSGEDGGSFQLSKIAARIDWARAHGAMGTAIYDSAYLAGHWNDFSSSGGPYGDVAGVPPVTWR